ncbi:GNAT family N-acetyltransferase [uncultured Dokdonia sp.]|uniref:GNAT family N-acetyltransferase n=1 Tax=uncultured Dokdonia sp. TaxID=575653 RepID=UPI00261035EC|nr:GNAT family N-acetyltransferase [uncultured Dokdonia sp.]
MITISDQLVLQPITAEDQPKLFELMKRIYPPAYKHFWQDQGNWYINNLYTLENLKKELQEKGSYYYFIRSCLPARQVRESVQNKYTTIGIFKIIENCIYPEQPEMLSFKVHRIYLDTSIQGKGFGKQLMQYAQTRAKETGHQLIWLDAMDQHPQAMSFYNRLGYVKGNLQSLDFELLYPIYRPMWYLYKHL